MSIQGSILGTVGAIAYGVKGLKDRQAKANEKANDIRSAQKEQIERFRKSIILDKYGENVMVPLQQSQSNKMKESHQPSQQNKMRDSLPQSQPNKLKIITDIGGML